MLSNNLLLHQLYWLIIAFVTVVILFLILYTYRRYKQSQVVVGELLVITGSISNLVDRIIYGGVIDFVALSYKSWTWPVFNVADMGIVIGAGLMIIQKDAR